MMLLIFVYVCSIILESDPILVAQRVAFRSDDIPLGEQTVASVCFCIVWHNTLVICLLFCK